MSTDPASRHTSYGTDYCKLQHDTYPFVDPAKSNLASKHVLITGASKGIGRATALSYVRAGASAIAIAARSPLHGLVKEMGIAASKAGHTCPKIIPLTTDVTDKASVERAAEAVKATIGHVDIIILNSGALEKNARIVDQDVDDWWNTWTVNLLGQFLTLQKFMPLLLSSPNKDKTIIALSSIGATFVMSGISAYQPGKLALSRMMESVNCEYGAEGVLAYSIHPGGVMSDLSRNLPEEMHASLADTPELPADTMVWLTKERREWLAGRYISCNWDMEEFESKRAEIEKRDLLKFRLAMGGEDPSKI